MVEIQLDTYTVDSISAHRKIRQDALFCLFSKCYAKSVFAMLREHICCLIISTILLIYTFLISHL